MKNISTILLAFCVVLFMSSPAFATGAYYSVGYSKADGSSSKQKKANKIKSSSQAARLVKSRTGGKVLKVKNNGRSGYKVKVIKPNGHIISVTVDAKSGKMKGK